MTRSTPLLLSRQAVMMPSLPSERDGMSAIAAPLAAITSASSATTIAGDGLGILSNTPPKKVLIPAHLSYRGTPVGGGGSEKASAPSHVRRAAYNLVTVSTSARWTFLRGRLPRKFYRTNFRELRKAEVLRTR